MPDLAQEKAIRADERQRLASLLEDHVETLSGLIATPDKMLDLIIFLLRLGDDGPARYDGAAPDPECGDGLALRKAMEHIEQRPGRAGA